MKKHYFNLGLAFAIFISALTYGIVCNNEYLSGITISLAGLVCCGMFAFSFDAIEKFYTK